MRKTVLLSTVTLLLISALAIAIAACGDSSTGSSTTLSASTSSATGGETTTSVSATDDTTPSSDTTSTSEESTTTTEAARTSDTADHGADFRTQYPSTESFNNSTWSTLSADPASHLGAAVEVTGQPADPTVDPDSRYLTWTLTVTGTGGEQMTALCRTNLSIDRSLLTAGDPVEVKGLVVGAQGADAGGGPIIYVESLQKVS